MSTRCLIGVEYEDKTIRFIYCHCDGYIEHVGKILKESYIDSDRVEQLLSLGNLSSLGRIPKNKAQDVLHKAMSDWMLCQNAETRLAMERAIAADHEYCDAFGGEDEVTREVKDREEYMRTQSDAEYRYLFTGDDWLVQKWTDNEFKEYDIQEGRR